MAAMMYNPACYCLLNGTVHIQPLKEENYQPPEHLKSFIPESMKEVWGMVIQVSRCIHKVIGAMEWLIELKCAPVYHTAFLETATIQYGLQGG